MELIDRLDAIEYVENLIDVNRYYHPTAKSTRFKIEEVIDKIKQVPTIDAVPVVRCKDCKLAETYGGRLYCSMFEDGGGCSSTEPDDFCSCGERRDDERSEG